ncbi:GTPase Era [Clavibacter sp. Sh2088]|uniref:GTPase Era n=1 Tax=Clavibacter sp. Sh2088 TaxID=3397676 RepID=UPI0039E036BF
MTDPRDDDATTEAAPPEAAPADDATTAAPAPLSDEAWGIDRDAEPARTKRKPRGGAPAYRAGFVSFVGRPNVGKSTLTNALVGEKVAITSSKPQTTRKAIRGIVHRPDGQLILVDTPGIHRPRTLLGERLNALVQTTLGDVDVIGLCIPADERIGPGDRFINEQLDEYPRARKIAIVTKTDSASRHAVAEQLLAVQELRDWDAIVPVSAVEAHQLDALVGELLKALPVSEQLYPSDAVTEEGLEARISELIREAALEGVQDELPHSLAVTIDDMIEREDKELLEIYANLFVERDSQKGIVIGAQGSRLKHVGQVARAQIEPLVGKRVFLSLRVKIAKDWQRDPKLLGRLGF